MSSNSKQYWTVAAGDSYRDYSQVFLDFGVMLIGPGDSGKYFENKRAYAEEPSVRRFAEEVKSKDVVVLKRGMKNIIAVGVVDDRKDSYFHSEVFSDVDGFSLQHGRYVTWHQPQNEVEIALPRGRLTRAHSPDVRKIADRIINKSVFLKPKRIPVAAVRVNDEELISYLINNGLSSGQAENVISAFNRIRRLGGWYVNRWEDVISEHETRTFLVVPLLLALGWPEQRLKIEWKNVDIAFFENNYANGASPTMILESKRLGFPLLRAEKQAKDYSKRFPNCSKLVASNGIQYLLFVKKNNRWLPKAYLNLLKPLDRHPYYEEIRGAPELLRQLLP
jgi:hypothetical protein